MTYPLPTDTAHVRLDSRQYRLFNVDLGEGIPRSWMKVGGLVFAPWLLFCWLVPVSLPFLAWFVPPGALLWWLMSRDAGGRIRLRALIDLAFWYSRRHRPIVNADTASSAPAPNVPTDLAFLVVDLPESPRA